MPVVGNPRSFHKKWKYVVEIDGVASAGFAKCSELSVEVARVDYWEGGALTPNKSPGRLTFADVTLERGATQDRDLYNWMHESGSGWDLLGKIIVGAVVLVVGAIGVVVSVFSAAVSVVSAAAGVIMSLVSGIADVCSGLVFVTDGIMREKWREIWTGMKLIVFGVVDAIVGAVLEMAGAIGGVVDALAGILGKSTGHQEFMREAKRIAHQSLAETFGVEGVSFTSVAKPAPTSREPTYTPGPEPMPAVASLMSAMPPPAAMSVAPPAAPININLQVDGETIARASYSAESDSASRAFSSVPASY